MKTRCLFWALLNCVLHLDLVRGTNINGDDLMDFDFADTPDTTDWQLEDAELQAHDSDNKIDNNMLDFSVDLNEPEPERHQVSPFDWREKVLRNALAKALTDEELRQKFVEVMPILRVLSSQQRLALSALISAQMNAKQGQELRLEQVRMMFGDDKKLLLPIVYDLANLVKNSARKYINLGTDLAAAALLHRRQDKLTEEESDHDDNVGTIDVSAMVEEDPSSSSSSSLEDFFDEMQAEVLDPQIINEALQSDLRNKTNQSHKKRVRRSSNEFIHKLTRSVPASVNEQQLMGGLAGRTIKLNTTAFQQPTDPTTVAPPPSVQTESYMEIEDLAFAGLNGTELPLNGADRRNTTINEDENLEPLPNPEELIAGPRYRMSKRPNQKVAIKRKRVQYQSGRGRPKTSASSHNPVVAPPYKKCERFTSHMCIRTDDYPLDQIMGSIRRHKNAMSALLAEFYDKPNNNLEFADEFDDYVINKKRREDEGSAGGMCQSVVRYARPQKAKSASGEWKFIVNTGQHTQTLRLEKCSNPGESCSYLAQTYRSHCSQVYNYHRLLSWDKVRGLHVDIFKVPTCCSCQVDGYRQQFPPLSSIQAKDYSPGSSYKLDNGNSNGYSTINEDDLDYNDESEEDELGLGFGNYNGRDTNELYSSSNKVRNKTPAPASLGPYLSPPDDEEQYSIGSSYKSHKSHKSSSSSTGSGGSLPLASASSKKYYNQVSRRRPQHTEARVDLDLAPAPSELHTDQEVNVFAGPPLAGEMPRIPLNRKRIYTSTHTATATSSTSPSLSPSGGAGAGSGAARIRLPQSTSTSLPARTGTAAAAAVGPAVSSAAHAHQTVASPNPAVVQGQRTKSRPRFYAPHATASPTQSIIVSPASSAASLPTGHHEQQQQHQSTALPPQPASVNYHVNSIYGGSHNGTKRVNYNYHPIIDFFEKNRRTETAVSQERDYDTEESRQVEQRVYPGVGVGVGMGKNTAGIYQHPIPTTSHERRMGFGTGGLGGAGRPGFANDNAWQPMVVEQ
ncbi:neurotrophin 1 [Drosophila tropicalis]|uniref:neurotrophin 1 n=1 Tax=Drosophila tropicalis TaxID=46794 RepID=UPI0035AB68D2